MSLHRTIVPAEVDEDEEPVDPKIAIDEKCSKTTACSKAFVEYEACAERIEKKGHGECSGQYMDYLACIDACVRCSLFSRPRNFCAAQFFARSDAHRHRSPATAPTLTRHRADAHAPPLTRHAQASRSLLASVK